MTTKPPKEVSECKHEWKESVGGKAELCVNCFIGRWKPNPSEINECDCVYEWELICPKCGSNPPNLAEKYKHLINPETNESLKEFDEFSVAKRFTDYPLISINDYVSTLSEIKKLFVSSIERARREGGNELIKELREYHDKYPDADWNDLIGYIVGWRSRYDKA